MATGRTTLTTVLAMNNTQFATGLKGASRQLTSFQKQVQTMRNVLAGGFVVGGILRFAKSAAEALDTQRKAEQKVEQAIRSTGAAAGYTSIELNKMASSLQKVTLYGDEEILGGATAQLLTFTNIAGKEFERTQKAILDISTVLDQDLKTTAIMVGKALNDPVANLGALGRSGIQFEKTQKALIKSLWEVGDRAEAQRIILAELERQYGGQAEAAAKVDVTFTQLQNRFGDFKEAVAMTVVPMGALSDLIKALKSEDVTLWEKLGAVFSPQKAAEIAAFAAALDEVSKITPGGVAGFFAGGGGGDPEQTFEDWVKVNDALREQIKLKQELIDLDINMRNEALSTLEAIGKTYDSDFFTNKRAKDAEMAKQAFAPTWDYLNDNEEYGSLPQTIDDVTESADSLGKMIGNNLVMQFGQLGNAIGQFASGAEGAFKSLGESIMSNIGNILIMMSASMGPAGLPLLLAGIGLQLGGGILGGLGSKGVSNSGSFGQGNNTVNFRVQGKDLVGVLDRQNYYNNMNT